MRAAVRRWAPALLVIGVADAALLLYAGTVMGFSSQLRTSAAGIAGNLVLVMGSVLPSGFVGGVGAILAFLGAGWWEQTVVSPALGGSSGAGLPALGGSLAAPVYAFVRRASRRRTPSSAPETGPPPHRVYVARSAKLLDLPGAASTGVQESM